MKTTKPPTRSQWKQKLDRLEAELDGVKETLRAIRMGEVDALIVPGNLGDQIFTLHSADQPYRVLVETMSEGAATLKADGMISYCNHRFAEILGAPLEGLIGDSIHSFVAPSSNAEFRELFSQGKRGRAKATLSLRTRAGVFVPIYLSMSTVEIEGQTGVCLIATDVSERLHLEEARADVLKLNIEKDLRERFVSTLSHDLRNPLASARLNSQMMVRYANQAEKLQMYGTRVLKSVDRADMMIQNLLDANSIRAGEPLALEVEAVDLQSLTRDLLEDLVSVHGDRFVLTTDGPVNGTWSSSQLRRLIENLAVNAIKYGSESEPVTVKLKSAGDLTTISVHNRGSYLAPEERLGLFRPYARSVGAISSGQRGWGLGLTLVSGVAEAHGGRVSIESSPTEGTTFVVTLPKNAEVVG